mmetsp:Transcript_126785/g.253484  ORF Transcript_126785/g.253484 Transcript_126785/m.253484 type:complete len:236 (+) Transcript_126785:184-891(+)
MCKSPMAELPASLKSPSCVCSDEESACNCRGVLLLQKGGNLQSILLGLNGKGFPGVLPRLLHFGHYLCIELGGIEWLPRVKGGSDPRDEELPPWLEEGRRQSAVRLRGIVHNLPIRTPEGELVPRIPLVEVTLGFRQTPGPCRCNPRAQHETWIGGEEPVKVVEHSDHAAARLRQGHSVAPGIGPVQLPEPLRKNDGERLAAHIHDVEAKNLAGRRLGLQCQQLAPEGVPGCRRP